MKAEGSTHYVSGRNHVPLPTTAQPIAPRDPLVECHCKHRGRLGAFHICITLDTPEPAPIKKPVMKRKKAPPKSHVIGRPPALNDEQAREIAQLYTDGMGLLDLASKFGVGDGAVRRALRRQKVTMRRPGRRGAA